MATVQRREEIPTRIQNIIEQLGRGLRGALMMTGGQLIGYWDKPLTRTSSVTPEGLIDAECCLTFSVNGKRGQGWRFHVAYEPSDTYTVRLWRSYRSRSLDNPRVGEVLFCADGVFCDALRDVVVDLYDRAIREHCDGFLPE
jgi:hypothetical protein